MPRDELLSANPLPNEEPEATLNVTDDPIGGGGGKALRPRSLEEFVGQQELKDRLGVILSAARKREQTADHLLFAGPPGLGKTTLAGIVATEMAAQLHITSGPTFQRAADLSSILAKLEPGDVLFIDEIHRLPRPVEEMLYPALEDFQIDVVLGTGPAARSIRLDLAPFTLVGATTRTGLITGPLRDRFGFNFRLDYYSMADIEQIVLRSGEVLEIDITHEGAAEIAGRSRGTPRIANRLIRRVRDYADVKGSGIVDRETAADGLAMFGIDERGLDKVDRILLSNLCERFSGGPVGLSTLAISVGESTETVEDAVEPFLIQQGLLIRTPRGRVATGAAWRHLGLSAPVEADETPDVTTLFD